MNQMASMITRHKRVDYFALNDGSDEEALPEDRLYDARSDSSAEILPDSGLFASEPASATESSMEIQDDNAICQPQETSRHIGTSTNSNGWQCRDYFNISERNEPWILKRATQGS
ncbi:hypothetical protein V1517DRAFT_333527 [Lipomyces orientalis]|uniref:Uncharacterized protein n=1 Tax=Lipomyces orientalis TaxID=1233043 RepID=A0ACC3TE42_9ASCO